jgi:hypothetical protein
MILTDYLTPKQKYIVEFDDKDSDEEKAIMWHAIKEAFATIKAIQKIRE